MGRAKPVRRLTVALFLFLLAAAAPASAAPPQVVATGLDDPRGIWVDDGDRGDRLLVAETASGDITEILTRKGSDAVVRPFATGVFPSDVAGYGWNTAFATAGVPPEVGGGPFAGLVRVPRDGESDPIADIAAYQETDPDPFDQEENPSESNPFGLAHTKHGFLVADSAGNDLLEIEKDGDIETVARFPTRSVPYEGPAGPEAPPPGTLIDSEAVPTAVAIGPDGAWYVSELRGFPFTKGTSRIWRIEPGSEDVDCDPDSKRGKCRVFADGFTSVIDIAWAGRKLVVLEIAKDGLLALEAGGDGPPPPGALWVAGKDSKTELAPGELVAPGGVAVADDDLYVTTGTLFGPDAGAVVRIKDALDSDGHPGGGNGHQGDDDDDDRHGGNGHRGDDPDDDHGDRNHKKREKHKGGKRSKNAKRYKSHRH